MEKLGEFGFKMGRSNWFTEFTNMGRQIMGTIALATCALGQIGSQKSQLKSWGKLGELAIKMGRSKRNEWLEHQCGDNSISGILIQ